MKPGSSPWPPGPLLAKTPLVTAPFIDGSTMSPITANSKSRKANTTWGSATTRLLVRPRECDEAPSPILAFGDGALIV